MCCQSWSRRKGCMWKTSDSLCRSVGLHPFNWPIQYVYNWHSFIAVIPQHPHHLMCCNYVFMRICVGLHGHYGKSGSPRGNEREGQDCVWQHPPDLRLAQRVSHSLSYFPWIWAIYFLSFLCVMTVVSCPSVALCFLPVCAMTVPAWPSPPRLAQLFPRRVGEMCEWSRQPGPALYQTRKSTDQGLTSMDERLIGCSPFTNKVWHVRPWIFSIQICFFFSLQIACLQVLVLKKAFVRILVSVIVHILTEYINKSCSLFILLQTKLFFGLI